MTTLVSGAMEAGAHSVPFKGTNLSSGVYQYTLQVDDARQTRAMLVFK